MAGGHGGVWGQGYAVLAADRNHLAFVLAVEQIVVALHAGELRPAIRLRRNLHVVELVGVHLAGAERTYLTGLDECVQRLHGLLDGRAIVESMNDVQVQIVGAKPLEGAVDFMIDGLLR